MRNAERSLFGSHDENYVARSRTRLLRSGWPPARGRNDPVGQECGSGADRARRGHYGLVRTRRRGRRLLPGAAAVDTVFIDGRVKVRQRARRGRLRPGRPRGEASRIYLLERFRRHNGRDARRPSDMFGSGGFLGGYRHTALDRDDAMVLGVGEFRAEE